MYFHVDQSSRIEILAEDSFLACSNGASRVVCIPRSIKRLAYNRYKSQYRQIRLPELRVFSAGLYILLKPFSTKLQHVIIDREYEGHHGEIKAMLLNYLRRETPKFSKYDIAFASIGKKANAHKIALATFRRQRKPDYVVTKKELYKLLGL